MSFFVCVVLHELGHSLVARRFGVRVPRILLLPIGGMAEFDRIPRKPSEELLITVAGPAVNFVLVAILLPLTWRGLFQSEALPEYSLASLLEQLCMANLVMGTFNLLPVFPMDGGRIFRALLAMKRPYLQATRWAATVGRVLALAFAAIALLCYNQALLCALFLFIFWAGDAEYRLTRYREETAFGHGEARRHVNVTVPVAEEPSPLPPLITPGSN